MNHQTFQTMSSKAFFGFCLAAALAGPLRAQVSVDSVITTNLLEPMGVVATSDGNIFVSDGANYRVVRYAPSAGEFRVLAGLTGTPGSTEGTNTRARFRQLEGIVLDPVRNGLVVADSGNQLIRFVGFDGVVTNLSGRVGETGSEDGPKGVARFRYPLGLAVDAAGNIFIADSKNNAIRKLDQSGQVTTLSTNFLEPAAVAVGEGGDLWVADTRNHAIKRMDSGGNITLMAGSPLGTPGYLDGLLATDALLNSPRGLHWLGGSSGLLISDGGNNVIRRLFFNPELYDYTLETFAGVAGPGGLLNGAANEALFSAPVGLCADYTTGGVLLADRANKQIRRLSLGPTQPQVETPRIGWVQLVKDSFGDYVTFLNDVESSVFNNAVTIAILAEPGTQTYYTYGPTPSGFNDTIPSPSPQNGTSPPFYQNGRPASEMPASLIGPQPDVTIKAIGTQDGRRSSDVVKARFQFKVGNPVIIGDNAAYFTLDNITEDAEMWYTLDGSEPTNNATANPASRGPVFADGVISLVVQDSNVVFKARGYKDQFKPSDVSTKIFTPSNYVANSISFGFPFGEASSDFVGSAGQRFYAPITLNILPNVKMYSLQFNVIATNLNGSPDVDGGKVGFESMLLKPINANTYETIPPAMAVSNHTAYYKDLVFIDEAANLLGVGWLERYLHTNLFNTLAQDLITYSQAHDTLFNSKDGKVILGGYSFEIPQTAVAGQTFGIEIGRPSATADGVSQDVYIETPTNGPVFAKRTVQVGQRRYVVGDVAPFRWFNAGDFGNTNLLNNDVLQVFQSAAYKVNEPPAGSDMFDAMDSCCGGFAPGDLFNGNDTTINNPFLGDGLLQLDDVFVTFRRSLDPSLKWYARYWSGGTRQVIEVPNQAPAMGTASVMGTPPSSPAKKSAGWPGFVPTAVFTADDVVAGASRTVQVPVRIRINGDLPVRVFMLNISVQPLEGSPSLVDTIQFAAVPALGEPAMTASRSPGNFAGAWLNNAVPGVSGAALVGTLTVTLPEGVLAWGAYRVHFDRVSASPNGLGLFACQSVDGLVTLADRTASSWNDGISDSWRLRYFGSVVNQSSAASADPDGDGVSNLDEFKAGTNPADRASRLRLLAAAWRLDQQQGVRLQWPTGLNRRYVLEYSTSFGNGTWVPISTNILGTGGMNEYLDTGAATRFYRVRLAE
jgi:hypothetical protein